MKKALIHYFSGTGNTYHMVNVIGNRIKQLGYEVIYNNIESGNEEKVASFDLHVFCYPIYAFGTPSIMLRYLKNLKPVKGCKTSIICSCVKFEGQSLTHVTSILKQKGYDVFLTDIGIYPHNWTQIANPVNEEEQRKVFENTDIKIVELSNKIASFQENIRRCNGFNLTWSWFVLILFSFIGRRILGKTFIADKSCISCGKCIKSCPVNAIKLCNKKPKWNWSCENCQRCMNICPNHSIQTSLLKLISLIVAEVGMVFALIRLNKYHQLSLISNLFLYCILFLAITFFTDIVINILERIPIVMKFFHYSYTKKYRRYLVKDLS